MPIDADDTTGAVHGDRAEIQVSTQGHARSKASQEKGWSAIHVKARKIIAERPDDHLSSILADLREISIGRADPGKFYRTRDLAQPIGRAILAEAGADIEDRFYHPDLRAGRYQAGTLSPIRYLAQLVRTNTTAVMELGSGWSSNLFQLYLARGATRSRKTIYYGGEYTREGQVCAKLLASREPAMAYRAFQFDYRDPDVTFLKRQKGHILLFTHHSIEQVDEINPLLFEQLRAIPNPVTVVHVEPVGWQRMPELLARREAGDDAFFEAIGARVQAGQLGLPAENAAWWSWRLQYNRNLLPILQRLEDEGAIRMVRRAWDFSGAANVLNPSSLLHYEFVRR
jgi:hypothetical protein